MNIYLYEIFEDDYRFEIFYDTDDELSKLVKVCVCGCGEIVRGQWANGHYFIGRKRSEENIKNYSKSRKGISINNSEKSKEYAKSHNIISRLRTSDAVKNRIEGIRKSRTLEFKHKLSLKLKGYKKTTEQVEKTASKLRGIKRPPEVVKKILMARDKVLKISNTSIEVKIKNELIKKGETDFVSNCPVSLNDSETLMCLPDILFKDLKIAIFCDGCYWHSCKICYPNKYMSEKWKNRKEWDKRVYTLLINRGYRVFRFWEHDIEDNLDKCIDIILKSLKGENVYELINLLNMNINGKIIIEAIPLGV